MHSKKVNKQESKTKILKSDQVMAVHLSKK